MESKPASLLVVPLGKAFNGISSPLRGIRVGSKRQLLNEVVAVSLVAFTPNI